jgi:lysophospholipase L1-like esterase
VVLMMGINDIGWPGTILVPRGEPAPAADDVIIGYQQLIARAHAHDMRILGVTLTPFEDTFQPMHIRADFDSGDHLHPQDTGYKAMADSIDLELLGVKP